jgi:hypothetical protein
MQPQSGKRIHQNVGIQTIITTCGQNHWQHGKPSGKCQLNWLPGDPIFPSGNQHNIGTDSYDLQFVQNKAIFTYALKMKALDVSTAEGFNKHN